MAVFIFTSMKLPILGTVDRLGFYIGYYLKRLSRRVKGGGGGLSTIAIIDFVVAMSAVINLCYLMG